MQLTRKHVLTWLARLGDIMRENKAYLTDLDAAIGDADHGINMDRGFGKVQEKLAAFEDKDIGAILKDTGMVLLSSVGGASGPLYGTFFMKAGLAVAGKDTLDATETLTMLEAGVAGLVSRGRPVLQDKTMYDAWAPALDAFRAALGKGDDLALALDAAVDAAGEGMRATIPMQARKGRASYLGERSIGHQDPGATSTVFMLTALRDVVRG
ncbi:dihydroxyacetone kinase subunit DhaL [Nitratidesulfovibrio vulgaris]|jgi:dihydroxyacetone kinase-like protein|uniref:DAK2 domain protein n=2 Tax=Nitratidesulfovibrio vulgaris TaxID=881 RepID=Q72DE9_NITV2|nr:dihydroxyacetone kinase subunit DhaL [Nitratidesulfovibrio vulgaris]GEB81247.1 dihydroxyacetone kinase subunit L [Desulfovibrio desulfuricans]HBW15255.1 dihydroxyacetone kinase subunit L [Desulfovibrio sp.]AAS95460.1 DAK2 domain protein [Nitratidesulfovibrio vulgaris str. Hildenborough]ABM29024.1 dihydroxyacetone kinase DhaL subunit [Nitratidesulfovibrio vulgaris DP4]ADP86070.1 dihydroxyacetone kinase, L subunit [Nitratidesulfovibrio vulgaris RCH1]